jgi:hypothetical protein
MRDAGWKRYENLEAAYWRFDALHNPHYHSVNPKMVGPMSERDAFKSVLAVEIATLEEELEQWRSGKRRVWWRTRWDDGGRADFTHLKEARSWSKSCWSKYTLYRVTVGPAKKPAKKKEAG